MEKNSIETNTIQTNTVQTNNIQTNTIQLNTIQTSTIQTNTIQTNTIQPNTIQTNTIQPNTIQTNTIQPNTIQTNTIQPNTIQTSTIQTNTLETNNIEKNLEPIRIKEEIICEVDIQPNTPPAFDIADSMCVVLYCMLCKTKSVEKEKEGLNDTCSTCNLNLMYQCIICNNLYGTRESLESHRSKSHGKPYFSCDKCSYKTLWKTKLLDHIIDKHTLRTSAKSHKCSKCDKSYKFRASMQRHERVCNGNVEYKCNKCDFVSKTFREKKHHMLQMHTRPSRC